MLKKVIILLMLGLTMHRTTGLSLDLFPELSSVWEINALRSRMFTQISDEEDIPGIDRHEHSMDTGSPNDGTRVNGTWSLFSEDALFSWVSDQIHFLKLGAEPSIPVCPNRRFGHDHELGVAICSSGRYEFHPVLSVFPFKVPVPHGFASLPQLVVFV